MVVERLWPESLGASSIYTIFGTWSRTKSKCFKHCFQLFSLLLTEDYGSNDTNGEILTTAREDSFTTIIEDKDPIGSPKYE